MSSSILPDARTAFLNNGICNKYDYYFPVYDRHFARYKGRDEVVMLEIGVQKGGAIEPWRQFFGPGLRYYGMDIDPACKALERDGVTIFIGDQQDRAALAEVKRNMPRPDIILDDGGHKSKQQVVSFEELYPWLKDDGTYMVEDIQTAFWKGFERTFLWKGRLYFDGFLGYAHRLGRQLTEYHWDIRNRYRYLEPRETRQGTVPVSDFCKSTFAMTWHDSFVVFEKRPMPEPMRWEG
ncbi:MAG: class I SAM-dependent methyltransferase [Acetobacteraceae bacterium]|nr:class I SAM-dependent methyltransferase [Acetobacteraceae bacterium]